MKVYYSGNFWGGHKYEQPGKEIPVNKEFVWGGLKWHIPAIYACSKGLVIDFCLEIPKERIETYLKRWNQDMRLSGLSDEELELMEKENPFSIDIEAVAKINGKELEPPSMYVVGWHPCEAEREMIEDVQEELMEYYDCDRNQGWKFIRACFSWKTTRKPKMKTLFLTLKKHPVAYSGVHFTTEPHCDRQEILCKHPVSKQEYKIKIYECETATLSEKLLRFNEDMQYPNYFIKLSYSISPELPQEEFRIQDCARSDKPKCIGTISLAPNEISSVGVAVIGSADGPSAIFIARKDSEENNKRLTCSSLHFTQVPRVEWRTIFYVKENENFGIEIIL
ncbi:MAG: hypothetical protein PHF63_04195 [Herbinix sp.]|nr:hypothetical protein [Herbinix sp.]